MKNCGDELVCSEMRAQMEKITASLPTDLQRSLPGAVSALVSISPELQTNVESSSPAKITQ